MFNILIDPGEGTVNNLYPMGFSIADLDMVIATHDDPDIPPRSMRSCRYATSSSGVTAPDPAAPIAAAAATRGC